MFVKLCIVLLYLNTVVARHDYVHSAVLVCATNNACITKYMYRNETHDSVTSTIDSLFTIHGFTPELMDCLDDLDNDTLTVRLLLDLDMSCDITSDDAEQAAILYYTKFFIVVTIITTLSIVYGFYQKQQRRQSNKL